MHAAGGCLRQGVGHAGAIAQCVHARHGSFQVAVDLDDGVIELRFNKNPVLSDIEKALMSGGLVEGTLEIQVLSKNKLKMGDTVLKRIK